ncbi:MAG: hypothetical protein OER96_07135, partial [Gammaproteobacteria bacterium]|nr:hypothetical protein [Gammaproteobacteria bacterium]
MFKYHTFANRLLTGLAVTMATSTIALAQNEGPVSSNSGSDVDLAAIGAIVDYWTPDRMANAVAKDAPVQDALTGTAMTSAQAGITDGAIPKLMPGWNPASGLPQPTENALIEITPDNPLHAQLLSGQETQAFGSPPANPVDYANYGKHQRWTWYGKYTSFPTSTIAKMFFTQNGSNFVCSATVNHRNQLITAGHCVSDG